jgi:ABC-type antimicrobial peptide transport system permease subunit
MLALTLASVGIFGVVSYSVIGRYRESGVRIALAATAWNVLTMAVRPATHADPTVMLRYE